MLERLGLRLENKRLSGSQLEGYKTIKALNSVKMGIFPRM